MKYETVSVHAMMAPSLLGYIHDITVRRDCTIGNVVKSLFGETNVRQEISVNGMFCELSSTFEEIGIEPDEDVYLYVRKWVPSFA